MLIIKRLIFTLVVLSSFSVQVFSQKTKIFGTVVDAINGEKVPFANVVFTGSTVGTLTDSLGEFELETARNFDSLTVSLLGYKTQTVFVTRDVTEEIEIQLYPDNITLSEVVVLPGENPAFEILRRVIANKPKNDPNNAEAYQYEVYHKVQFDLNHFTEKIKRNFFVRPFDYIWENTDTTEDGITYLPIILTESNEDHYFRKNPPGRKEFIKGRRTIKFFEAPKIMVFVNDMYISPNIYENFVVILDRSFPSPINDHYKRNYNFYLSDSIYAVNGYPCHYIEFRPKGKSDVAFTGEMYIDTNSYAVVQVDLAFSIEANINFVRNYWIRQNYTWIDSSQWFLTRSQVIGDFTVVENAKEMTGFFGRKTSVYRDIVLNQPKENSFYSPLDPVVAADSAYLRNEKFWEEVRGDSLSEQEQSLIKMAHRLNTDRKWIWMVNSIKMVATSWLPWGKVDLGNIFTFYSYNKVEGSRIKFGFRTNQNFYKHWRLRGYVAYGTRDNRFKFYEEANFLFGLKTPGKKNVIGASYRSDVDQQGRSDNMIPVDHVLTSFIRISGKERRTFVDYWDAYFERQWFTGFATRATFYQQQISPFGNYSFLKRNSELDTLTVPNYKTAGVRVNLRFAWGEKDLPAIFGKADKGLFFIKYPVISLEFLMSVAGLLNSDFTYQAIKLKLEHQLRLTKWGYLTMIIAGGVTLGKLPYPLLNVPFGNTLVLNDNQAFNLMNHLEFVSDKYVSLQLEQHFEGLLFNKIPGVRKAKLREFILGKMYYGTLTDDNNQSTYLFPEGTSKMKLPYFEAGFGIENILKIARVDFVWRINYREKDALVFIPKASFYFRF